VREYLSPALLHGAFTILGMPAAQWSRLSRATTVLLRVFRDVLRGGGESMAPAFDLIVRYLKALTDDVLDGGPRTPFLDALRELAADAPSRWPATAMLGQILMAGTEPMIVGAAVACREVWSDRSCTPGWATGRSRPARWSRRHCAATLRSTPSSVSCANPATALASACRPAPRSPSTSAR
jgi:hypothetical protein